MKLIEILVQKLPKCGGWTEGAVCVVQDEDKQICFSSRSENLNFSGSDWVGGKWLSPNPYVDVLAEDHAIAIISRDEYEAALAASKEMLVNKPVAWDGQGLPPVGAECEIKRVADWMPVTIRFISERHTIFTTLGGTEDCYQTCSLQFRPIRTEAERKRDVFCRELVRYLDRECDANNPFYENDVAGFYEAIAAGNIPGVKLEAPDA